MNDGPARRTALAPTNPPRPVMSRAEFTRRALIAAGILTLFAAAATTFVRASDVFFLLFAAVLLAILLRSVSDAVARWTGLGAKWALGLVLLLLAAAVGVGAYFLGSMVVDQFHEFMSDLPNSIKQFQNYLRQRPWGRRLLDYAPAPGDLVSGGPGSLASHLTTFFSTTFGVLGNLLVLLFTTLYLALSPKMYVDGAILLVPPRRRERAHQVLHATEFHLRWWLLGRAVSMLAVTLICVVGLWLVGVPQFLVLGLLAGLLTAVPYIGPLVGGIPGVLLALMQGPAAALWAVGIYVLAQAVDNYLISPNIQQNFVNLPPVLTIIGITLIGALFGALGLVVAAPLTVVIMLLVKMLYVEDTLGDDLPIPGE